MDRIIIRDLTVMAIIGTLPHERNIAQPIIFNIELMLDLAPAGHSDALDDTVNYQDIEQRIKKMAETGKFFLLEKLAETAAEICLSYDMIDKVKITLDKPQALTDSASVAILIERGK
ncbi:MAG: dihydroneopterin aldolase [Victivallaceae bacterium]|nr:dihydroneopterin aldolase [Victivallaceae bacterium]